MKVSNMTKEVLDYNKFLTPYYKEFCKQQGVDPYNPEIKDKEKFWSLWVAYRNSIKPPFNINK